MTKNITITVNDDFYKEFQSKKPQIGNVSELCRQAIKQQMDMIGEKDTKFLEAIRAQKQAFQDEEYNEAKVTGYREGKQFNYREYRELLNWNNNFRTDSKQIRQEDLPPSFQQCFKEYWSYEDNKTPEDEEVFLAGWVDGFLKFWQEVDNQV